MFKAIFLDKDGVINKLIKRPDGRLTSPWTLDEMLLFPNVFESVEKFKNMGYKVFVVTNQPGVLDGEMYMTDLDNICSFLEDEVGVDHVLYALKKDTDLYKPNNGMIEALIKTYDIDRSHSYLIGDRWKDIFAGNKSELKTIYIGEQYDLPENCDLIYPDYIKKDIWSACNLIVELNDERI
jgi:D-glycero-D-manno-heptose 1,7-bisphosphate phosphatase